MLTALRKHWRKERVGREEEEGRHRRNIGEQSSLTAQLFANSLHILQLHGREGGREDRKGEKKKINYTHTKIKEKETTVSWWSRRQGGRGNPFTCAELGSGNRREGKEPRVCSCGRVEAKVILWGFLIRNNSYWIKEHAISKEFQTFLKWTWDVMYQILTARPPHGPKPIDHDLFHCGVAATSAIKLLSSVPP